MVAQLAHNQQVGGSSPPLATNFKNMSAIPTIAVNFSDGNLLQNIANIDGEAAFIGTGLQGGNIGKVFIINNLSDAESQGITLVGEPTAHRQISEFYDELGGNQEIYVLLVANTVTMTQMLDYTSADYANKLINAGAGKIAYLGVFKNPAGGYDGGADFIDSDVVTALDAAKQLLSYQNSLLKFFRVVIEGRVILANETSINIFEPNTADNDFAAVLLGGSLADGSASVGALLGRKVKYPAHIKIGKVANGALQLSTVYIGSKKLQDQSSIGVAPVPETLATATLTVTNEGTDGDTVYLRVYYNGNWIDTGVYTKITGDNTTDLVATGIKNAINTLGTTAYYMGFTASVVGSTVTIIAPAGSGNSLNASSFIIQDSVGATFTFIHTNFAGGAKAIAGSSTLIESFHTKGYVSFLMYPNKAGIYFGIDNMANSGDYKLLSRCAVVDAVAKIAVDVFINELESEVDTNADGTILESAAVHLEQKIIQTVKFNMGDRITDFTALVDRTADILDTSVMPLKLRVQPKGYLSDIEIDLGLTA